ncbi:FtsB family cell division protein [Streptomyces sp. NPDC004285]
MPSGPSSAARTPFVLLVFVLLGGGLIALLVLNSALNQGSFQLNELKDKTTELTDEEQALQRDVDDYAAPDALERRARELGMVPGGSPAFLAPEGKVLGEPSVAESPEPPPKPKPRPSQKPPATSATAPATRTSTSTGPRTFDGPAGSAGARANTGTTGADPLPAGGSPALPGPSDTGRPRTGPDVRETVQESVQDTAQDPVQEPVPSRPGR